MGTPAFLMMVLTCGATLGRCRVAKLGSFRFIHGTYILPYILARNKRVKRLFYEYFITSNDKKMIHKCI